MTTTSLIGNYMSFIWHDLLTHAMDAYSTKSLTALVSSPISCWVSLRRRLLVRLNDGNN